jgi:hypothetical protein
MATANPITVPAGKFEWIVIVPDYENKLEKRMEVRPSVPVPIFCSGALPMLRKC